MRDLLFKNLTSTDKRKRVIASTEIAEQSGMLTKTTRHFIYLIKEVKQGQHTSQPLPYLYLLKEKNNQKHRQRFFCRLKGSILAATDKRLYLIYFVHSLKIDLKALSGVAEYNPET